MSDEKVMTLRVDEALKKNFQHVCKQMDTTASQELRKFMREFVKKNNQGDLFK